MYYDHILPLLIVHSHFSSHPTSCFLPLCLSISLKKKKKTKNIRKNKTTKQSPFCFELWPWSLPCDVVNAPSDTPLDKLLFLPSRYQLPMASELGTGLCLFPLFSAGFLSALFCVGLVCAVVAIVTASFLPHPHL